MRHDERGFAIPFTVLLITIITVMLASGFARVRADRVVAEGAETSSEALAVARSGLHEFVENQSSRPANGFTDTLYVTGGYAIVSATILQNPSDTMAAQLWVIRSTGYVINANTGSTPRARRTVAQIAQWQTGTIRIRAGYAAANGIRVRRYGTVYVWGSDQGTCSGSSYPGIRTTSINNPSNSNFNVYGSPSTVEEGNSLGQSIADSLDIDWSSILTGGVIPDYTSMVQRSDYPIIYLDGDQTFNSTLSGTGLLIVTGDLTLNASFYWQGVVLVGGGIDFNPPQYGFSYIRGATVSGLNELLSGNPSQTEFGFNQSISNWVFLLYDSCMVNSTLEALTGFAPIDNAWVDNWATY